MNFPVGQERKSFFKLNAKIYFQCFVSSKFCGNFKMNGYQKIVNIVGTFLRKFASW